jgi:hypothetical protein
MSLKAASLLLPVLRPAATTLNRALSSHTVCCQGKSEMFKLVKQLP